MTRNNTQEMQSHKVSKESIGARLMAGVLSIPIFEVALFFTGTIGFYRTPRVFQLLPLWFHVVYCLLAASIGLLFGFQGLAWLMGHLFFTHWGEEKNMLITLALWVTLLVFTSGIYRFFN